MEFGNHQLSYSIFSLVVAILGSWTALDLQRQVEQHEGRRRLYWLSGMAVIMGLSIWTSDYVALLGYDPGMAVTYNLGMTAASLLLAIAGTAFAFIAVHGKQATASKVALGGLSMGASIALSNYLGMGAIRIPAFIHFSTPIVILSFMASVAVATGAITTMTRSQGAGMRILTSIVLGGAMAAMHYAALAAVRFDPIPVPPSTGGIDQALLAILVISATTLLIAMGLMSSVFDRRLGMYAMMQAKASAASENHLRQILTRMPLGIVVISGGESREILFTNPQADAVLGGRSPINLPFLDADGLTLPARDNPFRRALEGEALEDRTLMRIARPDGRSGFLEIGATKLRDEDGSSEIVFMIDDATSRIEAETTINQAQKLETIGQLTGGVAHDFNNLLTPIVGGLDMLRREKDLSARAQRVIDGAMQASQRAATLVQRLLAFARRQTLQPRTVDAAGLLSGLEDLIGRTLGPTIDTFIETMEPVGVHVDPGQLELAILNLAINSRDAMPDGGRINITAKAITVDAHQGLTVPDGDYVCISVADNGTGMSEVTLRRAIEPFFSTKGVGKGTGLGLSMAHGLAAQSNGELRITSALGMGTRIDLFFPRVPIENEEEAREDGEVEMTPAMRVLVVDDEEVVRNATSEVLKDMGHEVIQASSGIQALNMIKAAVEIDLVVTDHLMPGMTGAVLARELSNLVPDLPVLVITGYANPDELPKHLPRLTKPFRQKDLARTISTIMRCGQMSVSSGGKSMPVAAM